MTLLSSCILFHGPGSRQAALDEAHRIGRLLADPIGDEGLKVDQAREFVGLMGSTPIGMEVGVLIVGPMDEAHPKSSDVLLKTIEEFDGTLIQPILWARDLGGVASTIQSRCLERWAPSSSDPDENESLAAAGWTILEAMRSQDSMTIVDTIRQFKGQMVDLLSSVADAMSSAPSDVQVIRYWDQIRGTARWRNPTMIEVMAALLPESI